MAEPVARYDAVADTYVASQPDAYDADKDIALFELIGPLAGTHVLDVGCGHGRVTRELARRGAHAVGVDLSHKMIELACQIEDGDPLGVVYVEADAASSNLLLGERYDAIVSNFALSDIDDFEGVIANVHRLLRPGSPFVFAILHPCFPGRDATVAASWAPGTGYYREGWWATDAQLSTLRQQVGANHRTLSTYLNTLICRGLAIDVLAEPHPPGEWTASKPQLEPVPTILVVRARKTQAH